MARNLVVEAGNVLVITREDFIERVRSNTHLAECPSQIIEHMGLCLKRRAGLKSTSFDMDNKSSQPRLVWLDHMTEAQARQLVAERQTITEAVLA